MDRCMDVNIGHLGSYIDIHCFIPSEIILFIIFIYTHLGM